MFAARIVSFINSLPAGRLFTTRDLVRFGPRTAVDQTVFRLVRSGFITRIARGIFVRTDDEIRVYSIEEIARVKAESFGRALSTHPGSTARELDLQRQTNKSEIVFAMNSHSSSFKVGGVVVCLKLVCQRRFRLALSKFGRTLSALWYQARTFCTSEIVERSLSNFSDYEKCQHVSLSDSIPAWLNDMLGAVLKWKMETPKAQAQTGL